MPVDPMPGEAEDTDRGFTLIELMIVLFLMTVVFAMCLNSLVSLQRSVVTTDSRTQALDQVGLAVQQIDREVRSGNIFYAPTNNGMTMLVYTQANGNQRCVQWQVNGTLLQSRSWSQTWQTDGSPTVVPWSTIATGVTNASTTPTTPAFTVEGVAARILNIDITTDSANSQSGGSEVTDSVEGRNTVYGYSATACSTPFPATS